MDTVHLEIKSMDCNDAYKEDWDAWRTKMKGTMSRISPSLEYFCHKSTNPTRFAKKLLREYGGGPCTSLSITVEGKAVPFLMFEQPEVQVLALEEKVFYMDIVDTESELVKEYLKLEDELKHIQAINKDRACKEEEDILDKMDDVWEKMSKEEIAIVERIERHEKNNT